MLHDPNRHEALIATPWSASEAQRMVDYIVDQTHRTLAAGSYWPLHPKDVEPGDDPSEPAWPMYYGAAGVLWALQYLSSEEAEHRWDDAIEAVLQRVREWCASLPRNESAAYLMGETPLLLMQEGVRPHVARADRLAELIEGNISNPARELMWGSPGTMLASLFLYRRFGEERWAELFRRSADQLWLELESSDAFQCKFWTQDLYGRRSSYLDAIHGFVATAFVLIEGRELLSQARWSDWQDVIVTTVTNTATRESGLANWCPQLADVRTSRPQLMQFCHGSPGFVICLAKLPSIRLDALLLEAGEATWAAGPLKKGANLCHGTGGNGYAFLKLYARTGDVRWLDRARAFAMHAIAQSRADEQRFKQLRYSLWTGDLGLAIYLRDCIAGAAMFPTLDAFYRS